MELGKQIKNEELVNAMVAIREEQNKDTQRAFMDALIKAEFMVPAVFDPKPETDDNGKIKTNETIKVSFRIITDKAGNHFMPCFTDEEEFKKNTVGEPVAKVVLRYSEVSDIILKSKGNIGGMVINPHNQGFILLAKLMQAFADEQKKATKTEIIAANTKIKARTPKYPPIDLQEKASGYFKTKPGVRAAYLQIIEKDDDEEEYLMVVDSTYEKEEAQAIFAELIPLIRDYTFGMKIGITPATNGLGAQVVRMAMPFYKKN